jgi:hypothetical protein
MQVLINSFDRNALSKSSSDFSCEFNHSYSNVKAIKLISYELANTIYNVTPTSNIIKFVENSGADVIGAELATGTYGASTLATNLQTTMNEATLNGIIYNVTYDSAKYHFTITSDSLNFHFDSVNNNAYRALGFDNVSYLDLEAITFTSPNAIRLDISSALLEVSLGGDVDTTNPSVKFSWLLKCQGQD